MIKGLFFLIWGFLGMLMTRIVYGKEKYGTLKAYKKGLYFIGQGMLPFFIVVIAIIMMCQEEIGYIIFGIGLILVSALIYFLVAKKQRKRDYKEFYEEIEKWEKEGLN